MSDVGLGCEKGKEVSCGTSFAEKYLKAITDLVQIKLSEDQLLDATTTEHFWKSLVSVAPELLRHNNMGCHCSSRLVVPEIGILGTKFCNESWYNVGIDGLHCSYNVVCVLKISKVVGTGSESAAQTSVVVGAHHFAPRKLKP